MPGLAPIIEHTAAAAMVALLAASLVSPEVFAGLWNVQFGCPGAWLPILLVLLASYSKVESRIAASRRVEEDASKEENVPFLPSSRSLEAMERLRNQPPRSPTKRSALPEVWST
uniref:Uncharacterized protein n=1 Tax=Rhizochromulina marina TaxID=1034831 RepID=A0A7S2WEH9_9STRA|mmetsp:Transcript_21870/g.63627  ORF Transcript_21870/g.63627 Transcript_21870/m.63627 type:complete len:114 (+) Transcript_21870:46-387(+)